MRNKRKRMRKGAARQGFRESDMREAVRMVIKDGVPLRKVLKMKNVKRSTLNRYVKLAKANPSAKIHMNAHNGQKILKSDRHEDAFIELMITCSRWFPGLNFQNFQKLALRLGLERGVKFPKSYMDAGMAGRYWLEGFVEKTLSTLSQRATDFPTLLEGLRLTKPGMSTVSMTLHAVAKRYPQLTEAKILNLNEIQVTSPEGISVTSCHIVSADGSTLAPVRVFPKDHFKPRPGDEALNLANPRKDTLDPEIFAEVIKHIAQLTKSSVGEPALVVMDDNDWHLSLEAIEAAKNNGVVMLAVPAHLSARVLALESLTTRFLEVYNEAVRESLQRVLTVESMTRFLDVAAEEVFTKEAVRDAFVMSELYRLTKSCGRQPEADQETEADGAVVLLVGVDDVSDCEQDPLSPASSGGDGDDADGLDLMTFPDDFFA
nr:PREDICTED: uncharacterized protein LOC109043455 [Bemisia tabaci]